MFHQQSEDIFGGEDILSEFRLGWTWVLVQGVRVRVTDSSVKVLPKMEVQGCVGVCVGGYVSGGEGEMILFMKSSGNEANPIRVEDRLTNPIMSVNWMHIVALTANCYSIIKLMRVLLSLYEQGKHGDKQPGEEADVFKVSHSSSSALISPPSSHLGERCHLFLLNDLKNTVSHS